MSGPVGPLLRATVRRMAGSAVSPDQLRLRLYSRNRLGERCVQDALAHVISDPTGAVRHLVAAAGYRQLLIAEKSGQAEPAVRGSVVTQETAGQFSDGALAAGDGLLTVNPFTYFNGQSQDRNDAVQHELWHLFMSKAFPGFAADLARLHKATRERVPYFREYFLDPFSHFFTRAAALEAGCADFVIDDAALELEGRMPVINALKGRPCDLVQAAAFFSGLLFSHVFAFALFSATGVRAMDNCKALKRLMEHFMSLDQIRQIEAFARDQLAGFRLGEDVDMGGQYQRVLANWQQFAAGVSRP